MSWAHHTLVGGAYYYTQLLVYQETFILYPMSLRKTRGDVNKSPFIGNRTYFV